MRGWPDWTLGTWIGQATFPTAMDDKSINLWRQIEDSRRHAKRQSPEPGKPEAPPAAVRG